VSLAAAEAGDPRFQRRLETLAQKLFGTQLPPGHSPECHTNLTTNV
jgi:hypothetical protein